MASIYYWGLLGVKSTATVTLGTVTFNSLITTISTAETLSSSYYRISLGRDPSVNNVANSATNFTALGILDGDTVICTPVQTGTKEAKQIQKLEIAQAKRKSVSNTGTNYYRRFNVYDRDLLAAKYVGNTATNISNTLTVHRPWV